MSSGYVTVPETGYTIPTTLGSLADQTEAQCQTACNGIPSCVGVTFNSTGGICKFMQMADLSKLGTADAANAPQSTALNCSNLCPGFKGCTAPKVAGVPLTSWLAALCVLLAVLLIYSASLATQLGNARSALTVSDLALASSGK